MYAQLLPLALPAPPGMMGGPPPMGGMGMPPMGGMGMPPMGPGPMPAYGMPPMGSYWVRLHWLLKSIEGCQIFQFTQRQMRFDPKRNWFVGTVRSASLVVPVNIISVPWQFWRAKSLAEFELITGCYIYYDRIGSAAWLWLDPVELGIARLVPFV
jgi:hypothetical protein